MIYLDSAATSLLKPRSVGEGMLYAMRHYASPGRGEHAAADGAAETVYACREEVAALFHVKEPDKVVFTMNTTHGLNIAVRSLVSPGMRVVISGFEHNAVTRPLYAVGARIDVAESELFDQEQLLDSFRRKIPGAGAVICTHVSNVFGMILPLEEIARLCREYNVPLIVDAAQSAGSFDIDFPALGAAFLAAPGHKGLLGPQGTGLLLCRDGAEPLLYGGTGGLSRETGMPAFLPDRLEAGTQNVCGIAGLLQGVRYIRSLGTPQIRCREDALLGRLIRGLNELDDIRVYSRNGIVQTGLVSVLPRKMDCETFSRCLGREGIAVRAGLHCAPLAHATAGTIRTGTVRFSVSPFNTEGEIDDALAVMEKTIKNSNIL